MIYHIVSKDWEVGGGVADRFAPTNAGARVVFLYKSQSGGLRGLIVGSLQAAFVRQVEVGTR